MNIMPMGTRLSRAIYDGDVECAKRERFLDLISSEYHTRRHVDEYKINTSLSSLQHIHMNIYYTD